MVDKIVNFIIGIFGASSGAMIGKYITVFVISLMPILELRGGLIAASLLKVPPVPAYIISIIGNLILLPIYKLFVVNPFNCLISFTVIPYLLAILYKLSPLLTI